MSDKATVAAKFPWLPPDRQNDSGTYVLVGCDRDCGERLMEDSNSYAYCLAAIHLQLVGLVADGCRVEEVSPGTSFASWAPPLSDSLVHVQYEGTDEEDDEPQGEFEILCVADLNEEEAAWIQGLRQERLREDREIERASRPPPPPPPVRSPAQRDGHIHTRGYPPAGM